MILNISEDEAEVIESALSLYRNQLLLVETEKRHWKLDVIEDLLTEINLTLTE